MRKSSLSGNMQEPENGIEDISVLKELITEHVKCTGSKKGRMILDNFNEYSRYFKKIIPLDYKKIIEQGVDEWVKQQDF